VQVLAQEADWRLADTQLPCLESGLHGLDYYLPNLASGQRMSLAPTHLAQARIKKCRTLRHLLMRQDGAVEAQPKEGESRQSQAGGQEDQRTGRLQAYAQRQGAREPLRSQRVNCTQALRPVAGCLLPQSSRSATHSARPDTTALQGRRCSSERLAVGVYSRHYCTRSVLNRDRQLR